MQGEGFGEEPERVHRLIEPGPQPAAGHGDDLGVVERQSRQRVRGEPPDFGRVRGRLRLQSVWPNQRIVGRRDQSSARVAVRISEGVKLLERDTGDAGLLLQLTADTIVEILILLDEPARQCPLSLKRRVAALDQQDLEAIIPNGEDDDVGRHGQRRHAKLRHIPVPQLLSSGFQFSGREIWRCYLRRYHSPSPERIENTPNQAASSRRNVER